MVKKTEYFLNDIGVKGVVANNSVGALGEVLASNGSSTYWTTAGSGPVGYTGSRGDTGFVGSKGDIGFTGSQGTTGFVGSQGVIGYTGSKGDIGFTGSQGIQGVIGFTGSQGVIGFTGSQGVIGFTGSQGIQGVIGYTGSAGPVAGSNTHITFNDSATANGSSGFTFTKTSNNVFVANSVGIGVVPDSKLTVAGADEESVVRFKATTGGIRIRPYVAGVSGAVIDVPNLSETVYRNLTLGANTVNIVTGSGVITRDGNTVWDSGNDGSGIWQFQILRHG